MTKNTGKNGPDQEIFDNIMKPMDFDPFDGIDIEKISIEKKQIEEEQQKAKRQNLEDEKLNLINPIEEEDLIDLSVRTPKKLKHQADINDRDETSPVSKASENRRTSDTAVEEPSEAPAGQPLRKEPPLPDPITQIPLNRAYRYEETNRLRERLLKSSNGQKKQIMMIISSIDGTGNTFIVSVVGYNIAYFINKKVLLIDLNMRSPQLHLPFGLALEKGFSEMAVDYLSWRDVIKHTGYMDLYVMTAGKITPQLSLHFNRPIISSMLEEVCKEFDFVLIDTSPLLTHNINNIDAVSISSLCDAVFLAVQEGKTTKSDLLKSYATVQKGGGRIDGVIYNQQLRKSILPKRFSELASRWSKRLK